MAMTEEEKEQLKREVEATMRANQQQGTPAPSTFEAAASAHIKHIVGVVSGKGGVGKSLVSALLACELSRKGNKVGLLDADITGPSIPRMFGLINQYLQADGDNIVPIETEGGIKIVSTNLMLENESDPVIWRGPVLSGLLQQFYSQCNWGDIDYLICDMPPGTGDVALTIFQSYPIEGVAIVSSPQDLVQMVVGKAVNMAKMMNIPVLGLVENMSGVVCPHCGETIELFGASHLEDTANYYDIPVLGKLPMDPALAQASDSGQIESKLPQDLLPDLVEKVLAL